MLTVFLDRDGVINHNRSDYVKNWNEFRFIPGARNAIARLTRAGCRLFVITNQACVGKGLVSREAITELHHRMLQEIVLAGGQVEAVLCCPHRPDLACQCRKPAPGLLLQAQEQFHANLDDAIFIGDSPADLQVAKAAGIPAILVLSGLGWRTALRMRRERMLRWPLALNITHAAYLITHGIAHDALRPAWVRYENRAASLVETPIRSHSFTPPGLSDFDSELPLVIDGNGSEIFPRPSTWSCRIGHEWPGSAEHA